MIIEYKKTTKDITAAHYGRAWADADWADYETNNPGYAVIAITEENATSVYKKYLQINDGVGTLHDSSDMSVSVSTTPWFQMTQPTLILQVCLKELQLQWTELL